MMTRDRLLLEIRAHHLLCLPGYRGLGYSDEFTQDMWKVSAAVFAYGTILKIVDRCDAICVSCPDRKGNECGKGKNSAAKIRKQDQAVAARLGVRIEDEVRSPEIWTLVRCRIRPPDLPQLCGECEWLGYCLNWFGERWRGLNHTTCIGGNQMR